MIKRLAMASLTALLGVSSAQAACYDTFGCANRDRFRMSDLMAGPSCDFLYTMRNTIYKEHRYCFQTERGKAMFGNAGCISNNADSIGLGPFERQNAATILQAEHIKGCPQ